MSALPQCNNPKGFFRLPVLEIYINPSDSLILRKFSRERERMKSDPAVGEKIAKREWNGQEENNIFMNYFNLLIVIIYSIF
jgi:hypothetical protein